MYNDLVGGNLDELIYADRRGGSQIAGSFICPQTPEQRCACRYHMRYTRGVELKGDAYDRLAEFQIDNVAVQRDIPIKQLEDETTVGVERGQLQEELGGIEERWESDRSDEEEWTKRPFMPSEEWRVIENGYEIPRNRKRASTQIQHWETIKWRNWRAKPTEDQWQLLGALSLFHRRRPVMDSTEEIGGYREKRSYRRASTEKKKKEI